MLKPLHDAAAAWAIEEGNMAFRIIDATGKVLAEIPFARRSTSNMSRTEARRMADEMVAAGEHLTKANETPKPAPGG